MNNPFLDILFDLALQEDIGDGDHTSRACIPASHTGKMALLAKQQGIIAGVDIAAYFYKFLDEKISFTPLLTDGSRINPGDTVFIIEGNTITMLQTERIVLNLLQRMSGIATVTTQYVEQLSGLKTKVLDTRKTTPGMRYLEKLAVQIGGGQNHRMGLYDMILIKDNHIDFSGGISQAIENTQAYLSTLNKQLSIEIEARSIRDVDEILSIGGVHRILLDNFSIADTIAAVKRIENTMETESSGNITLSNIRAYAECGVDYISVGALTHQISSLDLSLKAID